jgi:hypothetical protein
MYCSGSHEASANWAISLPGKYPAICPVLKNPAVKHLDCSQTSTIEEGYYNWEEISELCDFLSFASNAQLEHA